MTTSVEEIKQIAVLCCTKIKTRSKYLKLILGSLLLTHYLTVSPFNNNTVEDYPDRSSILVPNKDFHFWQGI